jgi:uncharacterized membrane protein YbaN (DUF454 family)
MFEFLSDVIAGLTWQRTLIGVGIFLATFLLNLGIVSFILVKLPADHFKKNHEEKFWAGRSQALRIMAIAGKNLLGWILVGLGIVMSLPGVPGQGLLTILLGIMLLDFPGKERLEQKLLHRPAIKNSINKLRARFGKPALQLD